VNCSRHICSIVNGGEKLWRLAGEKCSVMGTASSSAACCRNLCLARPPPSDAAGATGIKRALAAGQRVLIADHGALVEISPEGSRRVIRQIPPTVPVIAGQVILLQ